MRPKRLGKLGRPAVLALAAGCSGASTPPPGSLGPSVDQANPVEGVPDREADPAVVAVRIDGEGLCTGALLAPDLLMTARRCVDALVANEACPSTSGPRPASSLHVLVGEDLATAVERARGYQILEPSVTQICGDDVAIVVLDATIDDRVPLVVRATAPATGDHLRTVGFDARHEVVRDHVLVAATSPAEFSLEEVPCLTSPGAAAIDETTGELVGVLSRSDPGCEAPGGRTIYTRLDDQALLVEGALAFSPKAHASGAAKEKKGPVDMGASCSRGADCAAGTCVTYGGSQYCSRTCSAHDKCPAHFKCMQSTEGPLVCVHS